jgi:hypothetical protein
MTFHVHIGVEHGAPDWPVNLLGEKIKCLYASEAVALDALLEVVSGYY